MSVYTPLQRDVLEAFLAPYRLGRLKAFRGIAEGTENSNFFVSLEAGEYVLTLVERGEQHDLPFVVALLARLHQAHLPVAFAIPAADGQALRELAGKPALLQPRLPGRHVQQANAQHCREIGGFLARLHLATATAPLHKPSDRDLNWMHAAGLQRLPQLSGQARSLLQDSLAELPGLASVLDELPQANLHADLFRDNVLFDGNQLSGVIDFYNACSGPMLYDLAIALNDWCSRADGSLDHALSQALLAGYAAVRPLHSDEVTHWPRMLRLACLRFWLSRLLAAEQPRSEAVLVKDPAEFQQRLAQRFASAPPNLPLAL